MKELSIEQKAKAYDDIIERLKDFQFEYRFSPFSDVIGDKFPELKEESEDEQIRKSLIILLQHFCKGYRVPGLEFPVSYKDMLAWLEKQGQEPTKVSIWKHWKDGICGNGEGKLIYLIKNGDDYSLSSSLGFECDYIELSELDNLMLEKQGEQKQKMEEQQ